MLSEQHAGERPSHVLELSVPAEGSIAVEVGSPWLLSVYSSTPGSLNIRTVDGRMSHPVTGAKIPTNQACPKRRHPTWGIVFLVAGLLVIPVNADAHLHSGWIGGIEHNLTGLAVPGFFVAGMFVLGEWATRRDAARSEP